MIKRAFKFYIHFKSKNKIHRTERRCMERCAFKLKKIKPVFTNVYTCLSVPMRMLSYMRIVFLANIIAFLVHMSIN